MHKAFWFPWIYLPFILLDYIDFTCAQYMYLNSTVYTMPTHQQVKQYYC